MPHNASAKKRLRKSEDRRVRNKSRLTELKTIRKKLLRAIHDKQTVEAETLYRSLTQRLDQAAHLSTIHKNAAARVKSRLALKITALRTAPAAT
jgi:small subunit ribosomal protein S20